MYSPTTILEYLKLIDDAIFELEEMVYCVDEDLDDELADIAPHCQQIAESLKQLKGSICDGKHPFGAQELEYVPLIRRLKHVLPFYALLQDINRIQLHSKLD